MRIANRNALSAARLLLSLLGAWWCAVSCPPAYGRPKSDADRTSPNLAHVVTATCLGSEGNEWFSAGAFPGDDSIILAGVSLEPDLTLLAVKAKVIGNDFPPAGKSMKAFVRLGAENTGRVTVPDVGKMDFDKMDLPDVYRGGTALEHPPTAKELQEKERENREALMSMPRSLQWGELESVESKASFVKLHWMQPEATGFIGRFNADLKRATALYRLPRGAGSITAVALDRQGGIYVAGAATERIAGLCADRRTEAVPLAEGVTETTYGCRRSYIAKLSADLSKALWLVDLKGWSYGPKLRVLDDGNVTMLGPGLRVYTPAGKLVRAIALPNQRVSSGSAVDAKTGRYTRVGDWMSGTGREPYRNPRCNIYNPDGTVHKWLYAWRGPFVGVDALRLVADSAARRSDFDHEGNLVISTWSHGGNNVMMRYPYDVERMTPNALDYPSPETIACVVKMGPDHDLITATRWMGSAHIYSLACAADGSIAWIGSSNAICKLPNTLSAEKDGLRLVVTEPNLATFRFFSTMPGCGSQVAVAGCNDMAEGWGFASGRCQGRPMLLCLTGAIPKVKTSAGTAASPPLKNPVQAFGGGIMDGYALLLDLTPNKPLAHRLPEPDPEPTREPKPYQGPALAWPGEGQVFKFGTEKYITVKATFRDQHERMWPTFFQGRGAVGGTFSFGFEKAAADFTLDCPDVLQAEGDQSQRVCGELVKISVTPGQDKKGNPTEVRVMQNPVKLQVTASSPWQRRTDTAREGLRVYPKAQCLLGGTLHVGSRMIAFQDAECVASFRVPRGTDTTIAGTLPNLTMLTIRFTAPGKEIGLTCKMAAQTIGVQFTCSAACSVDYSAQKKVIEIPAAPELELDVR